ncbi:MAG TPA: hypothetical protein PKW82_10630 [Spirochaetales bacterium]|nr:hypothetical protein [Spirochaetales bacterium]
MRTSRRTDSGWIEADAAVALVIIALAAAGAAESGFAAARAARDLVARTQNLIALGNDHARVLVEAAE